jgi:hypothetical protein
MPKEITIDNKSTQMLNLACGLVFGNHEVICLTLVCSLDLAEPFFICLFAVSQLLQPHVKQYPIFEVFIVFQPEAGAQKHDNKSYE